MGSRKQAPQRSRRGGKTAHVAVRKDTMIMQAAEGPRVRWGVTTTRRRLRR